MKCFVRSLNYYLILQRVSQDAAKCIWCILYKLLIFNKFLIHLNLKQHWKTMCCQVDWLSDFDINDSWLWLLTVDSHWASTLLARLQCILAPSSLMGVIFSFNFFHCFVSVITIYFVIIHFKWYLMEINKCMCSINVLFYHCIYYVNAIGLSISFFPFVCLGV